jgi:N-acetylglucosaminyldiphosphoundecaprenol N-acetyl-beta-D-mannosaminyltransferase
MREVRYLGVAMTALTAAEWVETLAGSIEKGERISATYLNFHTLNGVRKNPDAAETFEKLDYVYPDGVAVLWTSRWFGAGFRRENILVSEYVLPLLVPRAIENNWSFYLVGGRPGVAARAADELRHAYPEIRIAGTHHGYVSSDAESQQVVDEVARLRPTFVLVGMGQPKQEEWIIRNRAALGAPVIIGVGGYLDKLSKRITAYPRWVSRVHLYWLYRLLTEPGNVWRRYTFGAARFALHVLAAKLRSARPQSPAEGPIARPPRPRRILFLNHNVVRGGGTFFRAFDAARYLTRRGHSVTLLSISAESRWRLEREIVEGVEIIHTPDLFWGIGRSGWDPWDVLARIRFVAGRKWDLIQAWDSRPVVILPALVARLFSRKRNAKLIIDWSDWWGRGGTQMERGGGWTRYFYNAIETFFEERFRRFADGTTVISTSLRDRAVSLGVPREGILLLPQGCEPPRDAGLRGPARREVGIAEDAKLFITVGVLNVSDAKLLFGVIRRVLRDMPDARFALIGRTRLKLPADLIGPRVTETGFVSTSVLTSYLAAADAFVVPLSENLSSRARWPSRVNAALSRGVPVVVSRVGDLPRFLEHENAAFVADPTAEDLARRTMDVVRDPAEAERVRTAAKRVATLQLSWPGVIDQLEDFYYDVLSCDQSPVAIVRASREASVLENR